MATTAVRISEMPAVASADPYAAALAALAVRAGGDPVALFHAVRAMPYRSGPDRTPQAALRSGQGACTAKHLILRDALRVAGHRAEVELVIGDFAGAIPDHPSMPDALRNEIRAGGVTDYHCRVRLTAPGQPHRRLDATWPDALIPYGFATARGWDGTGDTAQAIARVRVAACVDDVLTEKARLLSGLPPAAAARRLRFLRLLSDWLAGVQEPGN
jgi:hypothetical protein